MLDVFELGESNCVASWAWRVVPFSWCQTLVVMSRFVSFRFVLYCSYCIEEVNDSSAAPLSPPKASSAPASL